MFSLKSASAGFPAFFLSRSKDSIEPCSQYESTIIFSAVVVCTPISATRFGWRPICAITAAIGCIREARRLFAGGVGYTNVSAELT